MIRFTFKEDETIQDDDALPEEGKTAKLLLQSWADDEYADITPAAVVEVTPEDAKRMLDMLDAARALKESGGPLSDLDTITFFDYTPELRDTNDFPSEGMYEDPLDEIHSDSIILDEGMLDAVESSDPVRTEYSRLIVCLDPVQPLLDRVYWEMRVKYAAYSVDTDGLRRTHLECIAGTSNAD